MITITQKFFLPIIFLLACSSISAQTDTSGQAAKHRAEEARIRALRENLKMTIRNVDISHYPKINLIVEALDETGKALDSINPRELTIDENGKIFQVLSVEKISNEQRVPIDFVFLVDITGTMQRHINGIKDNIQQFSKTLATRGIDYTLGMITFTDYVEKIYQPTLDVNEFIKWTSMLRAFGGLDEKENALEALAATAKINFRPSANRVIVLITDAPYHQAGEKGGNGKTSFTTATITEYLKKEKIRVFGIVPSVQTDYKQIAASTRGSVFDLAMPFSKILDAYSTQLTNLYAITYRSDQTIIPDSIRVAILDEQKRALVRQIIPIVEIGRKIIIENLLFKSSSSTLPDSIPELDVLTEFMKNRKSVTIRIEGHTDSKGNPKSNKLLSYQRAESVKNYLVNKGVGDKRILIVGFGDSKPIADNSTDFGRSLNRRTEVVITSK